MEALPRLPMLSFDLKHSPEYIEFGTTLKRYIIHHYAEDPALYNKACSDLEQLRQAALQVTRDIMGITTLKKYYTQLEYLLKRFPMGEGGEAAIGFTWEDVQTGRDHMLNDIKFEQACILYNIGSLHSLLGVPDTRHNAEGMRVSCTHFQCAAWVFEYLRDNFSTSSMSTDMSYELLSFHITLMLAQAQECILGKSLIDNRKNDITAKVAARVVEYYKDASRLIDLADQKQQINSRMHKEWGRRLLLKAAFYQCITYYFLGRRSQELEKHGECLTYYTAARDELVRTTQLAKNEAPEVLECLQFVKDVVLGNYDSAKKDNDFVYHDKVPALESLPEVKGASLAKAIPVDLTDKEISGPDIFQKLVPMEAHEASSVYSEEKAKLSRVIVGEIEQKNMDLEQFMSSLQLDVEQLTPKPDLMPENLMEKCAAMSVRTNTIKELTDSMASVSGLTTEVELSIQEIQEMIDEDMERTDQFEKLYGKKNPSSVLPGLLEKLDGFKKRHEEGNQLNATLHKAMSTHINNLKTLALAPAEIQAMLPPSQPVLTQEDQEIVTEIRRLQQKVNEMGEQRKALLEQFRDKIQKDDITTVLVTQEKTDKTSVFAEQLKKHDQILGYIRQNLASQDNILRHLTDINAKYAPIRQAYNEASSRREKVVQELILSFEKYEELLAKSQKGAEYYKKLLQTVTETLERCRSECKVRQEERDMLTSKLAPKAPPPSRPTAPKPDLSSGTQSSASENANMGVPFLPGEDFSSITISGQPTPSAQFHSLPPTFEGPKLKDYLPFMKPRSFGPKAPQGGPLQQDGGSLPSSGPPDMAEFESGDYNASQKYPGLDPNLASVLPATIAQYLASVSSAGQSVAGGVRYSPSHSPSSQRVATPPRHSPSPQAISSPSVQPVGPSSTLRNSTSNPKNNIPMNYSEQTHPQLNPSMHPPQPANTQPLQYGTSTPGNAGLLPQQPNYDQYGYMISGQHPQQYPNVSRQANTSTVSSANQPIFSPVQETKHQSPFNAQSEQPLPQQTQWATYTPSQQNAQPQPPAGPMPLPTSAGQKPYQSASGAASQSFPPQIPSQQWPQNQFTGHGQILTDQGQLPMSRGQTVTGQGQVMTGQGQMPLGQHQVSKNDAYSLAPRMPGQLYGVAGYGPQQQVEPQIQQHRQTVGPHVYQPQSQGPQHQQQVLGVIPQQSLPPIQGPGSHPFQQGPDPQLQRQGVGSTQQGLSVGAPQPQGPLPQQYVPHQQWQGASPVHPASQLTGSPHQSPRTILRGHERVPVTSVGYLYAKGQHQGPLVADYAQPNQQQFQNVATTAYQPSQYIGGYQHGIGISYQNAQIFGTFTSKANVYTEPMLTQSQNLATKFVMAQGQGGNMHTQGHQQLQPSQGSLIQGQIQGTQIQSQVQGNQMLGQVLGNQIQVQGSHVQGQVQSHQMQVQGHPMQGQIKSHQMQGQVQGSQMPGQVLGQVQGSQMPGQVQGQVQGSQMPGQGQVQGNQIPGQVQGQVQGSQMPGQVQGQVQGSQMPGQVQGQVQGNQMPGQVQVQGSQVPGQVHGSHLQGQVQGLINQGLNSQTQVYGTQLQGQISGTQVPIAGHITQLSSQVQGPQCQAQGQQGIPKQGHIHGQTQGQGGQLQGQFPGGQGVISQFQAPASLPLVQPQHQPGQLTGQHLQQQLPNQGQHLASVPQQLSFSQPQPGFYQQPGAVTPTQQPGIMALPQQPGFQPQNQAVMQQQLPPQQLAGPYIPQHQLPVVGPFNQVPGVLHPGVPASGATTMKPPLQPTSGPNVRPPPPNQVLSRSSTPGSQTSSNATPTPTSPVGSKKQVSRHSSSLDDILSSSPNGVNDTIITPQVLTDQERQLQKEEALKNLAIVPATEPYSTPGALHKFLADVETFGKFVDELSVTILGVSRLDTVWKSLLDSQDAALKKQSMAIARCYPMKNRDPDIMPYDETRVILTSTKDDYINASWLNDLAPSCPKFITTQAPMPVTMGEFWVMVYEQGSEVLVQITSEYETGKKYPVYYPVEKDKAMEQGIMLLSLQSVKFRQHWVERIIYLKNTQTKQGRTIVHLQYKNWPVSGFPDDISSIVRFISEVHNFYMQQRSLTKPVIVHCGFGIGRTGVFTLVYAAMQEVQHGNGIVDIPGLARRMLQKRKGILHKKEQLKCCYDVVLCFAEEYLQKRGLLVKNPHFVARISPKHQTHSQPASDDIVLGTMDLQTIRENVGRLHVHADTDKKEDGQWLADQNFSKKSLESLPSISNSSLPDVVQQYNDGHIANELDKGKLDQRSRSGSDPSIMGLQNQHSSSTMESHSSSGPQSLPCPSDLNLGPSLPPQALLSPADCLITKGLDLPDAGAAAGKVPTSLAQLQDPATFTLGSPDSKQKSKITKANFHQSKGTLKTNKGDPDDPLGNLDPLWTLTKK